MARHTRIVGQTVGQTTVGQTTVGKTGRRAASALGALVFGAGLWLAPAANAEELVQLALLDLDKLEALSDSELDKARGQGGEAPGVDASISDQFAVILWDETKRQGTASTGSSGGGITVSVTTVEN